MAQPSLVTRVSSDSAETDRAPFKLGGIIAVAIITLFAAGYFFNQLTFFGGIMGSIFAGLFVIIFTLQVFFVKSKSLIKMVVFGQAAAFTAPFYSHISLSLGAAFLVLFFMLFLAARSGHNELENAVKIPFWGASQRVLKQSILALVTFMSVIYLFGFGLGGEALSFFVREQYNSPDFSFAMPIGSFLTETAEQNVRTSVSDFEVLSTSQKNALIQGTMQSLQKNIEYYLAEPLNPDESISATFNRAFANRFKSATGFELDGMRLWVLGNSALVVLIALVVKSLISIVSIPLGVLVFICYEFLLATNYAVVQLESKSREIIIVK